MRIDAHHHLWRYTEAEFGWIGDEAALLRRDFTPDDLLSAMAQARVQAAIAVQARCSLEETFWLLECASRTPRIAAVVGWAPLVSPELDRQLDVLAKYPRFVGVREIVQDQPTGFLLAPAFEAGVRELTARDLTYDILVRAGQLREVIEFVDRHPKQRFVLDHAGKPEIAEARREPWRSLLQELAQRSNVMCKLSGLVTEADWQQWKENDVRPYLDTCLEAFGPERCMAGSDWPVCLVASGYVRWWQLLEHWLAPFPEQLRSNVLGETAHRFYGLDRLLAASVVEAGA